MFIKVLAIITSAYVIKTPPEKFKTNKWIIIIEILSTVYLNLAKLTKLYWLHLLMKKIILYRNKFKI